MPSPAVAKKVPEPVDRHVGSRVRMRRLMLGMSQTSLADKLGLTFQQVQKYEKGKNRMGSSRLQQIANILQVPVTFFFEDAPGQTKPDGKAPSPAYVSDFLGHEGWAYAHEGFYADQKCKAPAKHRKSC